MHNDFRLEQMSDLQDKMADLITFFLFNLVKTLCKKTKQIKGYTFVKSLARGLAMNEHKLD